MAPDVFYWPPWEAVLGSEHRDTLMAGLAGQCQALKATQSRLAAQVMTKSFIDFLKDFFRYIARSVTHGTRCHDQQMLLVALLQLLESAEEKVVASLLANAETTLDLVIASSALDPAGSRSRLVSQLLQKCPDRTRAMIQSARFTLLDIVLERASQQMSDASVMQSSCSVTRYLTQVLGVTHDDCQVLGTLQQIYAKLGDNVLSKAEILTLARVIIAKSLENGIGENFVDQMMAMLGQENTIVESRKVLKDSSLLMDYNFFFDLHDTVRAIEKDDDARVMYLLASLTELSREVTIDHEMLGVLQVGGAYEVSTDGAKDSIGRLTKEHRDISALIGDHMTTDSALTDHALFDEATQIGKTANLKDDWKSRNQDIADIRQIILHRAYASDSDEEDTMNSRPNDEVKAPELVDPVENILARAYVNDVKQFDRQSRKSLQRNELHRLTKWTDEQIEGWALMLERDPKRKRKVLAHVQDEWRGNRMVAASHVASREESEDSSDTDGLDDENLVNGKDRPSVADRIGERPDRVQAASHGYRGQSTGERRPRGQSSGRARSGGRGRGNQRRGRDPKRYAVPS